MFVAQDATQLIGRTPLLKLNRLFPDAKAHVLAKAELLNPTSVKDRAVLSMIRAALDDGRITPQTEVVESTSGNTGIAIASLGAMLGFPTRLYMSELCSVERQQLMAAYGATLVLTPAAEHTQGARERAIAYCEANPETTYFLSQHTNPDNGGAHFETTGPEIWEQTGGDIGAVVIGLGTCGTFDGLSRYFKGKDPNIRIVGFEPASSPVYSGGNQGKHAIIGIGPGFVTENFKRAKENLDEIILVEDSDAYEWTRLIARKEGLLAGVTSGASVWAAGQLAKRQEFAGRKIICFLYDTGERYLSTADLFPAETVLRE